MKLQYFVALSFLLVSCQDAQKSTSKEKTNVEPTQKTAEPAPKKAEPAPKKAIASSIPSPEEAYKKQAEAVIEKITGGGSAEEVATLSEELTKTGLSMIAPLIKRHPECTEYLNAILKAGPTLHTLPLEEIESGYHADGKLPKMSSPTCYHGKDLVVHPATVTAMAKAGLSDRESAKHEIQEVIAHLSAVQIEQK